MEAESATQVTSDSWKKLRNGSLRTSAQRTKLSEAELSRVSSTMCIVLKKADFSKSILKLAVGTLPLQVESDTRYREHCGKAMAIADEPEQPRKPKQLQKKKPLPPH